MWHRLNRPIALILLVVCFFSIGCSAVRYGGAPEPSFDLDKDLKQLSDHFNPDTSIEEFYKGDQTAASRNKFVAARLVLINIRYIQFIRTLSADKQAVDTSADILSLSLNLAGTAVGSNTTKTILSAIAAGVTGTKAVVDKDFFFEKSAPALVAEMNAQRAQALIPILEGIKRPISDYPVEQAVGDLHMYYMAGTLLGAVQAIQADAGAAEAKAKGDIRDLQRLSTQHIDKKKSLTKAIGAVKDETKSEAMAAYKAVFGKDAAKDVSIDSLKNDLQQKVRDAGSAEAIDLLYNQFKTAGLINE